MVEDKNISRRNFIARSTKTAAGVAAASAVVSNSVLGANDRINIAVIGISNRGRSHVSEFMQIPDVHIRTLCDIDENTWPSKVKQVQEKQGKKPKTEYDLRKVFDDKDIDAVTLAIPAHWHALATIWACQAGKHVFVEKPTSHNIWEGRKMIEAAAKYNRIVSVGLQNRSHYGVRKAMEFLHEGGIGDVYMARGLDFKTRYSIGRPKDDPAPPKGVHYDIWLGPAPWRPFNANRFHYRWNWFWDYGMPDIGNQGVHQMDIARWGLNKNDSPKKIKAMGGYFAFDNSNQETPVDITALYEYDDGKILQFETRGLYTNAEDDIRIGNLFIGTKGWMHLYEGDWKTYMGQPPDGHGQRDSIPGPSFSWKDDDPDNRPGAKALYTNFINAMKSGNRADLNADIIEGHRSTTLVNLAIISYHTGREVIFDSHSERFFGDDQANGYLTRNYRPPYVVPEKV